MSCAGSDLLPVEARNPISTVGQSPCKPLSAPLGGHNHRHQWGDRPFQVLAAARDIHPGRLLQPVAPLQQRRDHLAGGAPQTHPRKRKCSTNW